MSTEGTYAELTKHVRNVVLTGPAQMILSTLPADIYHLCVTSPPYFGQRRYPTPPLIWGGILGCSHQWLETPLPDTKMAEQGSTATVKSPGLTGEQRITAGQVCAVCKAWCGSLGEEPTDAMYIEHLVSIFDQVRRVLRPDGVLFVNIADTYAASGGAHKSHHANPGASRSAVRSGGTGPTGTPGDAKPRDMMLIPEQFVLAMRRAGWYMRAKNVWRKVGGLGEPVQNRSVQSHEMVYGLAEDDGCSKIDC